MNKLIAAVLSVAFVLVPVQEPSGCGGPREKFYEYPTYVDPEFRGMYGPRTSYGILLSQYLTIDHETRSLPDSLERERSRSTEPVLFAKYQEAARRFHDYDYTGALEGFTGLRDAIRAASDEAMRSRESDGYSWVAEASEYMVARCKLIASQNDWHGYRSHVEAVDQDMLSESESLYQRYISLYPSGLYAESARNLKRKIYWLSGRYDLCNQDLYRYARAQFSQVHDNPANRQLKQLFLTEFHNHFNDTVDFGRDAPLLLAFAWLCKQDPNKEDLQLLETRVADFESYPGLHRYLRALGLYKLKMYQELLNVTPPEPAQNSKIWLSTELLRARCLHSLDRFEEAVAVLNGMYQVSPEEAIDRELTLWFMNAGRTLWLFGPESPLMNRKHLQSYAKVALSDEGLEAAIASEALTPDRRNILATELARRYLLSHRFIDLTQMLEEFDIPLLSNLKPHFKTLSVDAKNVEGLVEVGSFIYENEITPWNFFDGKGGTSLSMIPSEDLPKCVPCADYGNRTVPYSPPYVLFLKAAEIAKKSGIKSEAEAKALHYLVKAGRSGEWEWRATWYRKEYRGQQKTVGKSAFQRLHRLYGDSKWAEETPYHY